MACNRVRKKLNAFVDGELSPEEAATVRDHVNSCAGCRQELTAFRAVRNLLELYPEVPVPPSFVQSVVARAEATREKRILLFPGLWRWRALPVGWAPVLVFLVGLFLGDQIFQKWSNHIDQRLGVSQVEEDYYSSDAFQDVTSYSFLDVYWEVLHTGGDEDIP